MSARSLANTRTTCRLCGSSDLWKAISLNPLPVASPNVGAASTISETASADVWQCRSCGHIQLATVVDHEFQYRNFRYQTGISLGLREHFDRLIGDLAVCGDVGPERFVVDIGSNDGSLLRLAQQRRARVLGIDPAEEIVRAATASGIPTLASFFDKNLGSVIASEHGRAHVVISNNTIANIDELAQFFSGIGSLMEPDGILIIETQYAVDMLAKTLLDVIYHEHISYFAVGPMRKFLASHGFKLVDAVRIAPKGGSIRFVVQREDGTRSPSPSIDALIAEEESSGLYDGRLFAEFNARIADIGQKVRQRLDVARKEAGRALVYGASVGCVALINYFELGELVDAVFDDAPLTNVVRTATANIPVLSGKQLANEAPTDVAVLAWRYASPIARGQPSFRAAGGRFFRVLPDLAYVDGSDMTLPSA